MLPFPHNSHIYGAKLRRLIVDIVFLLVVERVLRAGLRVPVRL